MDNVLVTFLPLLIQIGLIMVLFFFGTFGLFFFVKRSSYQSSRYYRLTREPFLRIVRDKGKWGEYLTTRQLDQVSGYGTYVFNTYLPRARGEGTTEIDVTFIHESGIYVLESKNYSGWIFGREQDRQWTQQFQNRFKQRFYNPIKQNEGHLKSMQRFLEGTDPALFHSLIVFSERCELKKITVDSAHVRVLKRNVLRKTIEQLATGKPLTPSQVDTIAGKLGVHSQVDRATQQAHIDGIRQRQAK